MPTYDPAIRGGKSNVSVGGTSTVTVSIDPGTVNGDLLIVHGVVNGAIQINAPDGTWTRVNGIVSNGQLFTKIYTAGMNLTFTWDGTNQPFVFESASAYSQAGGTVSVDSAIQSVVGSASSKTSDAITPTKNALVLVAFIEFTGIDALGAIPGLTDIAHGVAFAIGSIYITSGVGSGTFTENGGIGNRYWASATISLISSIANPVFPPFLDDEVVYAPATSQTFRPAFLDDEVVFAPTLGAGAIHTTTENAEVALQASTRNLRVTTENAEIALQHALGATNLRITQDSAEIALQAVPPVGPVDFEIQTPGLMPDSGQQFTGDRLLLTVNCNVTGTPQILTPILIIDGVEYTLPRITNIARGTIDMPIHGYHGRFWEGVRIVGRLTGRVEVFRVEAILKQGVPSPRGG